MTKHFLGIDLGSTTLKCAIMKENADILAVLYQRTKPTTEKIINCSGRCSECGTCSMGSVKKSVRLFLKENGLVLHDIERTIVTGSQIAEGTDEFIEFDGFVSEVSAHIAGARLFHPGCKAILDVGGQDSKSMLFNDEMQMWTSRMSGICAAGTGAFLDGVANKISVPVESLAEKADYDSPLEFSSVCAVFSATSINKFKNKYPISQIIGAACRAQAKTIMSGVGELLLNHKGDILFQGGVAHNKAVGHFLEKMTGNKIIIPPYHGVMGAIGAANIARTYSSPSSDTVSHTGLTDVSVMKSVYMRRRQTVKEFAIRRSNAPLVWRNLFYPAEILNALDVNMLTLETYAAFFARNQKRIGSALNNAYYKGFSAETCSILRTLEGIELPEPSYAVSTTLPCLQGDRIFKDLFRAYGYESKSYSLQTPTNKDSSSIRMLAEELEKSVHYIEKALGLKMDMNRLKEACEFSNQAREIAIECYWLRMKNPPLIPGSVAVYFSTIFSQTWGRKEMVDIQKQYRDDLLRSLEEIGDRVAIEDTHRLLWLHFPPFYNSNLVESIEKTYNAPIVFEEINLVGWDKLDVDSPYTALAQKLLTSGFLDQNRRINYLKKIATDGSINGVVLYNHGFGRCTLSDPCFSKQLKEEFADIQVPILVLDGDCMDETIDPCSTKTKVRAFTEALNMKKFGSLFQTSIAPTMNDRKKQSKAV